MFLFQLKKINISKDIIKWNFIFYIELLRNINIKRKIMIKIFKTLIIYINNDIYEIILIYYFKLNIIYD